MKPLYRLGALTTEEEWDRLREFFARSRSEVQPHELMNAAGLSPAAATGVLLQLYGAGASLYWQLYVNGTIHSRAPFEDEPPEPGEPGLFEDDWGERELTYDLVAVWDGSELELRE